jgi:cytochrome c biogenesis protein CcmG/thiol:disulfide interchange protein DsbE
MPLSSFRRSAAAAQICAVALGLAACGQPTVAGNGSSAASSQTRANQLLDGGERAFRARLRALRGSPIVVNQWASWCGPCRSEFPYFQHVAQRYRGRVAFLGVDSKDSRSDAAAFLKQFPVPYPHYYDEDASIARSFGGGRAWPTTAFFRASGKLEYVHVGAYLSQDQLDSDIRRYALGG